MDLDSADRLHRRRGLAFGRTERAEIVLADQRVGRALHRRSVERPEHPAGEARFERWPH